MILGIFYIGIKISFIFKLEIRYEGILYFIDIKEVVVMLVDGWLFLIYFFF